MIDLKDMRRRIAGAANGQGVFGPTWINPREALALIDQVEAAQQDAARYQWLRQYPNNVGQAVYGPTGGLLMRDEYLDAAIDAAMAATKGEEA